MHRYRCVVRIRSGGCAGRDDRKEKTMINLIWGACGFAVGVILATIMMLVGVWLDEREVRR